MTLSYCLGTFHFSWKDRHPFVFCVEQVKCSTLLQLSFSFLNLCDNVFILPPWWRSFSRFLAKRLACFVFRLLLYFETWAPVLQSANVSDGKSAGTFTKGSLCETCYLCLVASGMLSLPLGSVIITCPSVSFFVFILLGICWDSWIFMTFTNLGRFWTLCFQILSLPFLSLFPSCISHDTCSLGPMSFLCSLYFASVLFFSVPEVLWFPLPCPQVHRFSLLPD